MHESKAFKYTESKSWVYRVTGDQLILETCPITGCSGWHFYMTFNPEKDGLYNCLRCGEKGNLYHLRTFLGDKQEQITSMRDVASTGRQMSPLPDVLAAHRKLMKEAEGDGDDTALDYLINERGFSMEIIDKYKLGLDTDFGRRWIVYPYFNKGELVYAKFRSLPPGEKEFRGVSGRPSPLFNEDLLVPGADELLFVEGEADALSCLSNGIDYVVGIPGANLQKAAWLDKLDQIAPKKIYLLYDSDKVGQDAAKKMASRIGIDKCVNILLPPTFNDVKIKDPNEYFMAGATLEDFNILKELAQPFAVEGVFSAGQVVQDIMDKLIRGESLSAKYQTRHEALNKLIGGFDDGDLVGILAEEKIGKAQPLTAKVLTPNGWTTMGELRVGNAVSSIDGGHSYVTGVYPKGVKDAYRVTFSDGRSTVACGDHLWSAADAKNFSRDGYKTVTTRQLSEGRDKKFVPLCNGLVFNSPDTFKGLDPWLLGALLGDGGLTESSPIITKQDDLFISEVSRRVQWYGAHTVPTGSLYGHRITGDIHGVNQITDELRALGLWGKGSLEKFIPDQYKSASREIRLELLQGLMDSDGSWEGREVEYSIPCFNTSSKQLAEDVQQLIWSLGGTGSITTRIPTFTHDGAKKDGAVAYRILPKLHDNLFAHSVKAGRTLTRSREYRLTVESVERVEDCEMQCIMVSHDSHLYITDDFIVTHNSTYALDLLDYLTVKYNEPGFFYCQEMLPHRLVRKWICNVTDTDDANLDMQTVQSALDIAYNRTADLLFGYTKEIGVKEVFETIRQAVRRYGIKFVVFDNLQLLCRGTQYAVQEISAIAKGFKALAMELGIVIFLIIQPHRVADGQIVSSKNVNGSSSVAKDVDLMLCLHRNRLGAVNAEDFAAMGFAEVEESYGPELLVRADLSRYSKGGATTLYFDGGKSKVTEIPTNVLQMQADKKPLNDRINDLVAA